MDLQNLIGLTNISNTNLAICIRMSKVGTNIAGSIRQKNRPLITSISDTLFASRILMSIFLAVFALSIKVQILQN
jgi:hypothetical protein